MNIETEIKTAISENRILIGYRQSERVVKSGEAKAIVVAKNCPEEFTKKLKHFTSVSGSVFEEFSGSGKQLGIFCGKPFPISTLVILSKKKLK